MSYLNRESSVFALQKMKSFHDECRQLYTKHGFDLMDNPGRRNIILSQAQEKFFADALSKLYKGVVRDGATGQPDIIVGEIDKELECKLTSRHKGGSISFQSDYQTLLKKGKLDYLYVVASKDFEKFAVLHFQNLTADDFRPLSNGSRGKVAMYKHKGMKKCNVLVGSAINKNEIYLREIEDQLERDDLTPSKRNTLISRKKYWDNAPAKYTYELEEIN